MRRPGVRIPLPPDPKPFGAVTPEVAAATEGGLLLPRFLRASKTTAWQASILTDDHGKRLSDLMKDFYYVHILVSETDGEKHYTGITRNLTARLSKHNQGACVQTSKNRPWKIEIAIAFRSEAKARRFEHYLKTGSGREFARRHL